MTADPAAARRWPVVLVLVAALVAGVVVQHRRDTTPTPVTTVPPEQLLPVASGPATLSSTWYCAAGTSEGRQGNAEQTVIVENAGKRAVDGAVTMVTDGGKTVHHVIHVGAHDHLDVVVHDYVTAADVAAIVEMAGGEVAVSHRLSGPDGSAVASCSTAPSDQWYLPAGTTRPGTHFWLALFNPFPSDAVANVTFTTPDGVRAPPPWNSIVVPGVHVVMLSVATVVTLRPQLATTVQVTTGRLVVDQVQSADGTAGAAKGMSVSPAAPRGASSWWLADGPATPGARTSIVVQNPSASAAHVSVQLRLDRANVNGTVSPFKSTVEPGAYWVIDIAGDPRVPKGVGYSAEATSSGGTPVVVARAVSAVPPGQPSGLSYSLLSPVLARRWLLPRASSASIKQATVVVTNPSSTRSVRVTVSTVTAGRVSPLQGTDPVEEVPAGGRGGFYVAGGVGAPPLALEVSTSAPVVVEIRLEFVGGGFGYALAAPVVADGSV